MYIRIHISTWLHVYTFCLNQNPLVTVLATWKWFFPKKTPIEIELFSQQRSFWTTRLGNSFSKLTHGSDKMIFPLSQGGIYKYPEGYLCSKLNPWFSKNSLFFLTLPYFFVEDRPLSMAWCTWAAKSTENRWPRWHYRWRDLLVVLVNVFCVCFPRKKMGTGHRWLAFWEFADVFEMVLQIPKN